MFTNFGNAGHGPFIVVIALVILAFLFFEIAMFVSTILNKSLSTTKKLLWLIGMLLIHPFVAIAYYFICYRKRK
jgi:hypothetical protein